MNVPKMSVRPKFQRAPRMSECAQCECAQNVSVPKISESAQCRCVQNVTVYPQCQSVLNVQSVPNVNLPKMSESAQCECALNVRVLPKCQWAHVNPPKMSECNQHECTIFGWLFLCPNFQNAPRVNVLMLAH